MEKFEFIEVSAAEVAANPEAIKFLEEAANGYGGIVSVTKTLQNAVVGRDLFIFYKNAIKLRAAIHLTISHQEVGKVLTSVLLGGVDMQEWASELRDFYYKLAKQHDCDEFFYMGRRGFKRYFPELIEAATVYRVILKAKP